MLKLKDLATRPDFELGPLSVSPSRRRIAGPAGEVHVEPLIMQVFLLLIDAAGNVVTRDELFDRVWGGVIVGDDSLNRAIAKVRRIATKTAPGSFEIETIPRTGYRLTGALVESAPTVATAAGTEESRAGVSRRLVIGGAAATAAVAAAGGTWWMAVGRRDERFQTLMEQGEAALRLEQPIAPVYFRQAVQRSPDDARAWGLLSYSLVHPTDRTGRQIPPERLREAEQAARRALAIDSEQVDALLTNTVLQNEMLDWYSREQRYLELLELAPDNPRVMRSLGVMLHGVGRCRDALALTERALAIAPLSPDLQLRRALRLWVVGRPGEADQVIDGALQMWPTHRFIRNGRLMIYAFTGRPRAALALVEEEEQNPTLLSTSAASVLRTALRAMETRAPPDIAKATDVAVEVSRHAPAVAAYAILFLSELGRLDEAFAIARGFLLGQGSVIVRPTDAAEPLRGDPPNWRNTFGLFTPPTAAMRNDRRFWPMADGLGFITYWKRRGIGPDAFLFQS